MDIRGICFLGRGMGVVVFPWFLVIELYLVYPFTRCELRTAVKGEKGRFAGLMQWSWQIIRLGVFACLYGLVKRKTPGSSRPRGKNQSMKKRRRGFLKLMALRKVKDELTEWNV